MHHTNRSKSIPLAPGYDSNKDLSFNLNEDVADVILRLKGFGHFCLACVGLEHVMRVNNFGKIPIAKIMRRSLT